MEQSPSPEAVIQLFKQTSPFMEPEVSLLCSQ